MRFGGQAIDFEAPAYRTGDTTIIGPIHAQERPLAAVRGTVWVYATFPMDQNPVGEAEGLAEGDQAVSLGQLSEGKFMPVVRFGLADDARMPGRTHLVPWLSDGKIEYFGPHARPYTPCDVKLRDGSLLLLADIRQSGPFDTILFDSTDGGKTWSNQRFCRPKEVGGNLTCVPSRVTEMPDGSWLLVGSWYPGRKAWEGTEGERLEFYRSTDRGKTWQFYSRLQAFPPFSLSEASVLVLPDGRLLLYAREARGDGFPGVNAYSGDLGKTWQVKELPFLVTGRTCAGFLKDGRVMLTFRTGIGYSIWRRAEAVLDDPQTGRHVVAWSAERDGFPDQYQLDHILEVEASVDGGDQGYSGWTQLEDGRIYVVAYTDDTAPPCPGSGAGALGVAWIRGTYLSLDDLPLPSSRD